MTGPALDAGLARERTSLAWTRTALGLLGNGVLVMVRHQRAFPLPVSVALAALSVLVALLVLAHSVGRASLVDRLDHEIGAPTFVVVSLGLAVTTLAVITLVAVARWV